MPRKIPILYGIVVLIVFNYLDITEFTSTSNRHEEYEKIVQSDAYQLALDKERQLKASLHEAENGDNPSQLDQKKFIERKKYEWNKANKEKQSFVVRAKRTVGIFSDICWGEISSTYRNRIGGTATYHPCHVSGTAWFLFLLHVFDFT